MPMAAHPPLLAGWRAQHQGVVGRIMAHLLTAINANRPKINLRPTVQLPALVGLISSRTGLSEGEVRMVLEELSDAVTFFNRQGQGVKLVKLGTYLPKLALNGKFGVSHRLDVAIKNALNAPGSFSGEIVNRKNIGKSADDLLAQWNAEHPDDPVQA